MAFDDEDHAAQLLTATSFERGGIWTRDGARQFRMARRVKWSDLHQQL
jgi:aldehyde dehydrogenase (NAD+)